MFEASSSTMQEQEQILATALATKYVASFLSLRIVCSCAEKKN